MRVNERAPSVGVAYCSPASLGRSRVEGLLSVSLCIMLAFHALAPSPPFTCLFYIWTSGVSCKRRDISGMSKGLATCSRVHTTYTHLATERNVFLLRISNNFATGIFLTLYGFSSRANLFVSWFSEFYFLGKFKFLSNSRQHYCSRVKNYLREKTSIIRINMPTQPAVILTIHVNFGANAISYNNFMFCLMSKT